MTTVERKPVIGFKNPVGNEPCVIWVPPEVEAAIKSVCPQEAPTPEYIDIDIVTAPSSRTAKSVSTW